MMGSNLLHTRTLVRSISTSHHISYVRQLTTTISSITTLFQFMFQFTSQFILSSLRKHLSSITHCHHFPVNYERLLSSFWIVHMYVSRVSTIVCKEGCPLSLTTPKATSQHGETLYTSKSPSSSTVSTRFV